jgi:hypothetical protein
MVAESRAVTGFGELIPGERPLKVKKDDAFVTSMDPFLICEYVKQAVGVILDLKLDEF